ncbi:MAG: Plug domain-containing protein, partial [Bacteroidota bacterium]|nr:Plug domain-containing protein [Bacteroidota bacterium]
MRVLILILLVIYANNALGQIVIIKDSLLNVPIESVSLSFQRSGATSNKHGAVDIGLFNNNDIIKISHLSYHSKKMTKKKMGRVIYLTQKTNILPAVILAEKTKVPISEKNPVFTISPAGVSLLQTSTANLLSRESSVMVQESQSGGGSPNYRGMEANRLLLVIDEIPLNNAIYRSGHLQSLATINPFFIRSIKLLSGPASVGYGNGAMGGALIFNTQSPTNKNGVRFHQQFESSSNTVISNFQANYYKNKLSHITA